MQPFTNLDSTVAVLNVDDVDTDQIVPARFLKITDRDGLEAALFADWRAREHKAGRTFPLDTAPARDALVLVAGDNFGCGSSREHAVWALLTRFRAVIAPSFADIFRSNALENGLLPVVVDTHVHATLLNAAARGIARVAIDLEACTLTLPDGTIVSFDVDPFARRCLLDGADRLDALLRETAAYDTWRAARPQPIPTTDVPGASP